MHGVKRARNVEVVDSDEIQRKREKEAKKIAEYTGLVQDLYKKRSLQDHSQSALDLSTKVLSINPEFQTGWNIRRTILSEGFLKDLDENAKQDFLENDLNLTSRALHQNPKNYSVWEHRRWVMEVMPAADWALELQTVEALLKKDARNFHGWDYRRSLIASIKAVQEKRDHANLVQDENELSKPLPSTSTESEFQYTTNKIAASFSNFSAWHYRTKLLPVLMSEKDLKEGDPLYDKKMDEEFTFVQQALWSDPDDQSAWLYHRWLIGKGTVPVIRREVAGIKELLQEEPKSRWCLESIVYYNRLLSRLLETDGESSRAEREELNSECLPMLKKLEQVDPMRKWRYQDMSESWQHAACNPWEIVTDSKKSSSNNKVYIFYLLEDDNACNFCLFRLVEIRNLEASCHIGHVELCQSCRDPWRKYQMEFRPHLLS